MKRNNLFLSFLVVLMLVFAGCSSGGSSSKKTSYNLGGSFNGGDDGLGFEFATGLPPEKVFDGGLQSFNIRLLIENLGEDDLEEGEGFVSLSGINPADFGLTETSKPIPALRGVKKQGENVIPGVRQPVLFTALKYAPTLPSGVHTQTIYANVCYPYQTKSLMSLCINGNTLSAYDENGEICELEGTKAYANSGAPVMIENVMQYPAGESSIQFQFDIVHTPSSEEGRVYRSSSIDSNCKINGFGITSTDAYLEENYVTYTVETGISGIDCENTGTNTNTVQLSRDTDRVTVFCTQDTTGQEEYEKPVTVLLDYDYFDRKPVIIDIEHVER